MNMAEFSFKTSELQALQQQIADQASITVIESYARRTYHRGLWDVSLPDAEERTGALTLEGMAEDLQRAVRYLDMRELLKRPVPGQCNLVSIKGGRQ